MKLGCIYAQKNAFTHRYGLVKLICLTSPPGDARSGEHGGGLVLPRPREEKNGHNSASVGVWNSYKTDISNSYMGLQFFFCLIIKKKKNKKSNHEWGDRIPPHSLIFSSISENLKKIWGNELRLK